MLLGASLGLDPEMLATILNTSVRHTLFTPLRCYTYSIGPDV